MRIFDRHPAVLAVAEQRNVVHRTRPVKRDERDDVAETGRADRGQGPPHALRFQLEHADRVAALEQLIDRRVVPGQRAEIDLDALLGEQSLAFLQHRKRLQAQEVELHQARRLDIFHVELGDRHVRARVAVKRNQLVERTVADHDARGVGRGVARQSFELHRQIEQAPDVRRRPYTRLQLRKRR